MKYFKLAVEIASATLVGSVIGEVSGNQILAVFIGVLIFAVREHFPINIEKIMTKKVKD